jgi:hypothetical protein
VLLPVTFSWLYFGWLVIVSEDGADFFGHTLNHKKLIISIFTIFFIDYLMMETENHYLGL